MSVRRYVLWLFFFVCLFGISLQRPTVVEAQSPIELIILCSEEMDAPSSAHMHQSASGKWVTLTGNFMAIEQLPQPSS